MTDADKYRILPLAWESSNEDAEILLERDRRQAEYIAASEDELNTEDELAVGRFHAARAALMKHIEEHP